MLHTHQTLYHGFRASTHWGAISSDKKSKYLLAEIIKIGYTPHLLEWWKTIAYVCIDNLQFFFIDFGSIGTLNLLLWIKIFHYNFLM